MTYRLFRPEAVEAKRRGWLGPILIAMPLSGWWLTSLAVALATSIVLFLCFGHYTPRATVSGQLVPVAGLLNIAAPNIGTVTRVHVHDGQTVREGDALLDLSSSDQDSAALGDTHALVGQQLDAQRKALQDDLHDQQQLSQQRAGAFRLKISLFQAQLAQITAQLAIQQQYVDRQQRLLARIEPLRVKGYISWFQIQQQQELLLEAEAQYKTLVRQQLSTKQEYNAAQQELAQLPLDVAGHRNATKRQLAIVMQSVAQNEQQRAVVLRAPRAGVVSTVLLRGGQMVSAGQPLLSLLPKGSVLQAQLLVPSRAIGFVAPGSRVALRYQAYPYQKFGQQYGRVTGISRSALSPADIMALVGRQLKEPGPLYRVQVSLDSQNIMAYGREERIKPGMALEADILMDQRRLIEWVFEPLYGMARHLEKAAHG